MKKTLLAGGAAVLIAAFAPTLAAAQDAPERPARTMRADADRDGRLSQAEFVGARLERLRAADANGDGSVTREEMQASRQAKRAERIAARFERLDADSNGVLTRAEFEASLARAPEARGEMRRGGPRMRGHGRHQNAGRAMRGERAAQPVSIAAVEARLNAAFARLDTDSDGFLTAAEVRAGRAERGERRGERRGGRRGAGAQQASPSPAGSE